MSDNLTRILLNGCVKDCLRVCLSYSKRAWNDGLEKQKAPICGRSLRLIYHESEWYPFMICKALIFCNRKIWEASYV